MVLNFNWDDDDYRQFLAVHEFGHALGLAHPHQLSFLADALDEDKTKEWLEERYELTSEEAEKMFSDNFRAHTGVNEPDVSRFDARSVMCYP